MTTPPTSPRDNDHQLPAAVLWDMDGTLVDTEPYWIASEFALVAAHGGTWSLEHAHTLVGNDLLTSAQYLQQHARLNLAPAQIIDLLLDGVIERIRRRIPWRPGARELLAELQAREIPCALVTMSYRSLAHHVVNALPDGTFATLVTGDDVTHGKPHPEPYLTATTRLSANPAHCLAIEDSPTGLASAVAAGIPTLGIPSTMPLTAGPGLHIVNSLTGLTPADLGRFTTVLRATPAIPPDHRENRPT
jgi:HAD superfamily hydrolase (TIGR01509 family)